VRVSRTDDERDGHASCREAHAENAPDRAGSDDGDVHRADREDLSGT
jgi:hypothetical protein